MKPALTFLVILFAFAGYAQPKIEFEKEAYDFGDVPNDVEMKREMKFKNAGNEPLIIERLWGSDGGMLFEYSRDPVLPGRTAVVKARYSTHGRLGPFNRQFRIVSNAPEVTIKVKGRVIDLPVKGRVTDQPTKE